MMTWWLVLMSRSRRDSATTGVGEVGERRKLALGDCGRAYGTDCVQEHACVRCPVLIVDASERPRLVEIRDSLLARILEAEREGRLGKIEGLRRCRCRRA